MTGYQLSNQIENIYQEYIHLQSEITNSSLPNNITFEEYVNNFYINHSNSHTAYSREVRNMFQKDIRRERVRDRLRKKLADRKNQEAN